MSNFCEKRPYTRQEANAAAKGVGKRTKYSMKSYKCKECGHWHIATLGKNKKPKWNR